jgi:hypothetical protein
MSKLVPGQVPAAYRRSARIDIDDIAANLGISVEEAAESVERLIKAGWLTPLGNGRHALTMPSGPR